MVAGFIFYYLTVGRLVLYFSEIPVTLIRLLSFSFFEILYYPVRFFVKKIGLFVKKIYTNIYKTIAKRQKMVYNNIKEESVMVNACHGFLDITKECSRGT